MLARPEALRGQNKKTLKSWETVQKKSIVATEVLIR